MNPLVSVLPDLSAELRMETCTDWTAPGTSAPLPLGTVHQLAGIQTHTAGSAGRAFTPGCVSQSAQVQRRFICRFSKELSTRTPVTCVDAGRLNDLSLRSFSSICHFLQERRMTPVASQTAAHLAGSAA